MMMCCCGGRSLQVNEGEKRGKKLLQLLYVRVEVWSTAESYFNDYCFCYLLRKREKGR